MDSPIILMMTAYEALIFPFSRCGKGSSAICLSPCFKHFPPPCHPHFWVSICSWFPSCLSFIYSSSSSSSLNFGVSSSLNLLPCWSHRTPQLEILITPSFLFLTHLHFPMLIPRLVYPAAIQHLSSLWRSIGYFSPNMLKITLLILSHQIQVCPS